MQKRWHLTLQRTVLPSCVSHYLAQDSQEQKGTVAKGLYFGFIAALGILTVNVAIGLVIALLGSAVPFAKDPRQAML